MIPLLRAKQVMIPHISDTLSRGTRHPKASSTNSQRTASQLPPRVGLEPAISHVYTLLLALLNETINHYEPIIKTL